MFKMGAAKQLVIASFIFTIVPAVTSVLLARAFGAQPSPNDPRAQLQAYYMRQELGPGPVSDALHAQQALQVLRNKAIQAEQSTPLGNLLSQTGFTGQIPNNMQGQSGYAGQILNTMQGQSGYAGQTPNTMQGPGNLNMYQHPMQPQINQQQAAQQMMTNQQEQQQQMQAAAAAQKQANYMQAAQIQANQMQQAQADHQMQQAHAAQLQGVIPPGMIGYPPAGNYAQPGYTGVPTNPMAYNPMSGPQIPFIGNPNIPPYMRGAYTQQSPTPMTVQAFGPTLPNGAPLPTLTSQPNVAPNGLASLSSDNLNKTKLLAGAFNYKILKNRDKVIKAVWEENPNDEKNNQIREEAMRDMADVATQSIKKAAKKLINSEVGLDQDSNTQGGTKLEQLIELNQKKFPNWEGH